MSIFNITTGQDTSAYSVNFNQSSNNIRLSYTKRHNTNLQNLEIPNVVAKATSNQTISENSSSNFIAGALIVSNSTIPPKPNKTINNGYFYPLSITTDTTPSLIRDNYYNMYNNTFSIPPTILRYYAPTQHLNTIYYYPKNLYANNAIVSDHTHLLSLSENYNNNFLNKEINIYATYYNSITSSYELECDTINNCFGLMAFFKQPSYDSNSTNYLITTSMGLAFNIPDNYSINISEIPIVTNIILLNETIVSIIHPNIYTNQIIAIKHPLISNYLLITLSNLDTNIYI